MSILNAVLYVVLAPAQLMADLFALAVGVWLITGSRYSAINKWADKQEEGWWPWFLQWAHVGNPATWVHHTFVAACVALAGGLTGLLFSTFALGMAHWAVGGFAFYLQREVRSWIWHARKLRDDGKRQRDMWSIGHGWKLDAIMDVMGPAIVLVAAWAWALP